MFNNLNYQAKDTNMGNTGDGKRSETKLTVAEEEEEDDNSEEKVANKKEISAEENVLSSSFDMLQTLQWTGWS